MIPTTIVSMWFSLQLLAEAGVKTAHDKKQNDDAGKDEIAHRSSFGFSQKRE